MYFSLANVKIRLILKFNCLNVIINVILLLYANNGCEQRLNCSYTTENGGIGVENKSLCCCVCRCHVSFNDWFRLCLECFY